jgi:hypothetical protein
MRTISTRESESILRSLEQVKTMRKLLDRLLTCVTGPDSKGYKLAEIMKIAEEWNQIR